MKKTSLFALVLVLQASADAAVIKNVVVCAAECQSEILGHINHDKAKYGNIYYAPATAENLGNSGVCLSNAKSIDIVGDRINGLSAGSCASAVKGDFQGQAVTLDTAASAGDSDEGVYFKITL